jgi:hypothetical protein
MILVFFTVKIPKLLFKAKAIDVPVEPSKGELCRTNTMIVLAYFRCQDEMEKQKLLLKNQEILEKIS